MIPISRRFRQQATIIRTLGSYNEFGEWQAGLPLETEAACASAPDTGQERDLGEEGARIDGPAAVLVLPQGLTVQLSGDGHTTDQIKHDGVLYRVVEVQHWRGSHARVVGSAGWTTMGATDTSRQSCSEVVYCFSAE